jgi:hypothetical protein
MISFLPATPMSAALAVPAPMTIPIAIAHAVAFLI